MMLVDRYLLVRAAVLYITAMLTLSAWLLRSHKAARPSCAGGIIASFWNLPFLLALNVVAVRFGWWEFDARGGMLLEIPVDFLLSWAWLWGFLPALAFPNVHVGVVSAVALTFDLAMMPLASPVLRLGPSWLIGEAAGLLFVFVPAQLLARWTMRGERLAARTTLQVVAFSGLILFLLPLVVIEASGTGWKDPLDRPGWQLSLIVQILLIPAAVGLSAVQEFVTRGGGTPVPFDPPKRLVTSGMYGFVRNPMQLSAALLLFLLGLALQNLWLAAAGLMAHVYSVGLAGWDEEDDLRQRFGDAWIEYRRGVRSWLPRVRPWHGRGSRDAVLYVAASCDMCSEVGRWFRQRGAVGLAIVPAESHPSRELFRITYESSEGTYSASGIEAIARALEHVHLGWALAGCVLRLPVIRPLVQLLVDASGGEPRRVAQRPGDESAAVCTTRVFDNNSNAR